WRARSNAMTFSLKSLSPALVALGLAVPATAFAQDEPQPAPRPAPTSNPDKTGKPTKPVPGKPTQVQQAGDMVVGRITQIDLKRGVIKLRPMQAQTQIQSQVPVKPKVKPAPAPEPVPDQGQVPPKVKVKPAQNPDE